VRGEKRIRRGRFLFCCLEIGGEESFVLFYYNHHDERRDCCAAWPGRECGVWGVLIFCCFMIP